MHLWPGPCLATPLIVFIRFYLILCDFYYYNHHDHYYCPINSFLKGKARICMIFFNMTMLAHVHPKIMFCLKAPWGPGMQFCHNAPRLQLMSNFPSPVRLTKLTQIGQNIELPVSVRQTKIVTILQLFEPQMSPRPVSMLVGHPLRRPATYAG